MAEVVPGQDTPVEAPVAAPVQPETPTPEPDTTADQVETKPEGEPEKTLTQSEVNKIVAREKAAAERRALKIARAEAERDYYKRLAEEKAQPQPQPGKPKQEDYPDWESFQDAKTEWLAEQKFRKLMESTQKETAAQREEREAEDRAREIHETLVSKGREKYGEEFDEVVMADDMPISDAMLAASMRLPNGADVLWHLANSRSEALRIARLSPVDQVWELKDISSKLSAPPATTKAPPPIVPNGTRASSHREWGDMNTAEHVEKWLKRKR